MFSRAFIRIIIILISTLHLQAQELPTAIHSDLTKILNGDSPINFFIDENQNVVLYTGGQIKLLQRGFCTDYRMTPYFVPDSIEVKVLRKSIVNDTLEWYTSRKNGVYKINPVKESIKHYKVSPNAECGVGAAVIQKSVSLPDGRLFFVQYNNSFFGYSIPEDCFKKYNVSEYLKHADGTPYSNRVRVLLVDSLTPNTIWLGSDDGLIEFNLDEDRMIHHPYSGPSKLKEKTPPLFLSYVTKYKIILFSWEEGVRTFDTNKKIWTAYPNPYLDPKEEERCNGELVILNDSTVLASYRYYGIYKININTGAFSPYLLKNARNVPKEFRLAGEARRMHKDKNGNVWILQSNGVLSTVYKTNLNSKSIHKGFHINSYYIDPETKDIFLGGSNGALQKLSFPGGDITNYYVIPGGISGEEDDIHGFYKDSNQQLYALGNREIYKVNNSLRKAEPIHIVSWKGFTDNRGESYNIINDSLGYWWIPMKFEGILRMKNLSDSVLPIVITDRDGGVDMPWTYWTDILELDSNNICISSERGLAVTNDGGKTFTKYTGRTKDNTGQEFGVIREITANTKNRLWVSTDAGNLGFIENRDEPGSRITKIGKVKKLYDIACDSKDNLWVLGGGKLCRYDNDGVEMNCYSNENGLYLSGCYRIKPLTGDQKGHDMILFCGNRVQLVDLSSLVNSEMISPLKLVINSFRLHNQTWWSIKGHRQNLVFKPDENYLSFRFHIENIWGNTSSFKVSHRIPQLNSHWNQIENYNEVAYTNLPGGNYTLQFKLTHELTDKVIGEVEELNFRVKKWFYNTIWFRALAILTLVGIAYLIWKSQLRRMRREDELKMEAFHKEEKIKAEYQRKMNDLELASLRSQLNPHFLFNCLSSIKSSVLQKDYSSATLYLDNFSDLMRQVLNNSREKLISLSEELKVIKLYVALEQNRYKDKFEFNVNVDDSIDPGYFMVPPLLIQPFIENSIWHGVLPKTSGKGIISLNIYRLEGAIKIEIIDNGIGRAISQAIQSSRSPQSKSLGTTIIEQRLKTFNKLYGGESLLNIEDLFDEGGESAGTRVVISLDWPE